MKKLLAILLLSPFVIAEDLSYEELKDNKAMAVNIETGESFYVQGVSVWDPVDNLEKSITKAKLSAITKCDKGLKSQKSLKRKYDGNYWAIRSEEVKNSKCKIFKVNDVVIYQDLDGYFEHEEIIAEIKEKSRVRMKYAREQNKLREEQERLRQEELILTALVDRCTNFGWKNEDNIASCVKQEAYRDLQTQEQEYRMKLLEQRLINANANTPKERPLFLDILDFYIEESERKENAQLRRDIMILKSETRSLRNRQNTEAALKLLYRGN